MSQRTIVATITCTFDIDPVEYKLTDDATDTEIIAAAQVFEDEYSLLAGQVDITYEVA